MKKKLEVYVKWKKKFMQGYFDVYVNNIYVF